MKVEWLDRSLICAPYFCLALDADAYSVAMDDLDVDQEDRDPWILNAHSNATVHFVENGKKELCAVVCLRVTPERTGIEIAGLLLHEAVHIWQRFRRRIGEHTPSDEFEAYSIQWLSQQLWWSYQEQTK